MGKHTPIDTQWVLARPKVSYYGAYPAGFLHRARYLLGVQGSDPVLHVCGGKVRDYPMRGMGPRDMTVDLDPALEPDWVMDVTKELPRSPFDPGGWHATMADPPYSEEDAKRYLEGKGDLVYPNPKQLLKRCFEATRPGGRVGFIHYAWPSPPKIKIPGGPKSAVEGIMRVINGKEVYLRIYQVACIGVICGYNNRNRTFGVWELALPEALQDEEVTPRIYERRPGVFQVA